MLDDGAVGVFDDGAAGVVDDGAVGVVDDDAGAVATGVVELAEGPLEVNVVVVGDKTKGVGREIADCGRGLEALVLGEVTPVGRCYRH